MLRALAYHFLKMAMTLICMGSKVKAEIREKVVAYQNECDDVLWRHWEEKQNNLYRIATEVLTPAQQRALQEAVSRRAGELPAEKRGMAFPKLWGGIKSHFQVWTYKDLSPTQYDAALSYIDSYEWEVLDKEIPVPTLGSSFIPEDQANEIKIRLNRVGKIFHPFSEQFMDLNGVVRLLQGLSPNVGCKKKGYVMLVEKW